MSLVFQSTEAHLLRETLNEIITDKTDGIERDLIFPKYLKVEGMSDAFEDDIEIAGPGLASEKFEGQEMMMGSIKEGPVNRYFARTFAIRLGITREAMKDNKYPAAIDLGKLNKAALWKTAEVDGANVLARAWNSTYTFGDGQPLASTAHPLAQGGTYSNTLATPMSPSVLALSIVNSACKKLPGPDGLIQGFTIKKVVFPTEQWAVWGAILKSEFTPTAGNFSEVNVVNSKSGFMNVEPVEVKWWTNTTTNWGALTDAPNGLKWKWRERPDSNTWVENSNLVMWYGQWARWSRGCSNPRGFYGSQA